MTGFDLGEIQDAVDETQEVPSGFHDLVQILDAGELGLVLGFFEQKL